MKIGVNRPAMAGRDLADILAALINVGRNNSKSTTRANTSSGSPSAERRFIWSDSPKTPIAASFAPTAKKH